MRKQVIIFGTGCLASLAWYMLNHDSNYNIKGFTVDCSYMKEKMHEKLPVFHFEDILNSNPPDQVSVIISIGFTNINGLRMERYNFFKNSGYDIISYVSSYAVTWPDLDVKQNTIIYENTAIQPFVSIGENVTVRGSVNIAHHCLIGSHSFIASGVTIGGNVIIGERCFLGLGSVVRDNIKIADRSFIGAGAVVVADTEPDSVYIGNPAKKINKTSIDITR